MGTTYSSGKLIIAPRLGGYSNVNYYVDDNSDGYVGPFATNAIATLLMAVNPNVSLVYAAGNPSTTITNGFNVAGYYSHGGHNLGGLPPTYPTDGTVRFGTNSNWYVITTAESYNGDRYSPNFGTYITWSTTNSFGGANYSNTPVGMVVNVAEPGGSPGGIGINGIPALLPLWETGRPFAICAWAGKMNIYFLAIGDPLVAR
jgi:hypothetical protein